MSNNEMIKIVEKIKELEEFALEIDKEAEELKNQIKKEMENQEIEEIDLGRYVVRYKTIITNKLNINLLKQEFVEIYNRYIKQVVSKRFSIQ